MRAQHVPEPSGAPWLAGVVMLTGVDMTVPAGMVVTWAGRAPARIAHAVQDAGPGRLQHIDNNHRNAIANDPQTAAPAKAQRRGGTMATMTLSTAFTRMFSLRQTLARLST